LCSRRALAEYIHVVYYQSSKTQPALVHLKSAQLCTNHSESPQSIAAMSKRNSISKRRRAARASVEHESTLAATRAAKLRRKADRKEANRLAGELDRMVKLVPAGAVGVGSDDGDTDVAMDAPVVKEGRVRKRNLVRKKREERLTKIAARLEARKDRDIDMFGDDDEYRPVFKMVLAAGGSGNALTTTGSGDAEVATKLGVRRVLKKSQARKRRDERKQKARSLMRESVLASAGAEGDD
jgi:hypothetical protein